MRHTHDTNINALVAQYSRIGQQQRRARYRKFATIGTIAPLIAIAGFYASQFALRQAQDQEMIVEQTTELRELGDELRSQIDAVTRQREELEQQSSAFALQSAALADQLNQLDNQRQLLEAQGEAINEHNARLVATLDKADRQRIELAEQRAAYRSTTPQLEREIAALNDQRLELQTQQQEFQSQSDQLARELAAINAQREQLETQRRELEEQQQTVNELLEQVSELRQRKLSPGPAETPVRREAVADGSTDSSSIAELAAVNDNDLGNMRGGISIGGDMDITVGLTRTASVNGVEQYNNSFHIDGLSSGISPSELADVSSVLIQNGAGNVASPAILEALSGNYATVIQNSLDNQEIATETVLDISIGNVSSALRGLSAQQAVSDSLSLQR